MIIAPSLLSADLYNLESDLKAISSAEWVHVDSMDGQFVPNISFGANIVEAIRPHTDQLIDCHLMIQNPEHYIDDFIDAGADSVTIQVESTEHPHRALQQIKNQNVKAGITLNPGTPVELLKPLLPFVDLVLVMTVNPGFGGQAFIPEMMEKIEKLVEWRKENNYDYLIQVDGGVNDETAVLCKRAGADVLVAGSYVYNNGEPERNIHSLKEVE